MDIQNIINTMRARMPWTIGQMVLAEIDAPRGRGWDLTLLKYKSDLGHASTKAEALSQALKEHLICGEKSTRFYSLSASDVSALRDAILRVDIADSSFRRSYPESLPETDLEIEPLGLKLTAVEKTDDGIAVIFNSARVLIVRDALDLEELPEEVAEALGGFDEIMVSKKLRLQAADVLWIPNEGNLVDVRVDYPKGMPHDLGEVVHGRLIEEVNKLTDLSLFASPVNLFPLIDKIYNSPKEGRVVELGFGTTTASIKHERMRLKSTCLRNEDYHVGGKAALETPIEPFRLSVVWDRPGSDSKRALPELSLNSSVRIAGQEAPSMNSAIIRNCAGLADFEFIRSRLDQFWDREKDGVDEK